MNIFEYKKLPSDIVNHIEDYAAKNYKILFSQSLDLIRFGILPLKSKQNKYIFKSCILDNILYDFEQEPGISFERFIEKNIDMSKIDLYIKYLSQCKCCSIHQQKRPISLDNMNNTPQIGHLSNTPYTLKSDRCQCCCRQFSRQLCRTTIF